MWVVRVVAEPGLADDWLVALPVCAHLLIALTAGSEPFQPPPASLNSRARDLWWSGSKALSRSLALCGWAAFGLAYTRMWRLPLVLSAAAVCGVAYHCWCLWRGWSAGVTSPSHTRSANADATQSAAGSDWAVGTVEDDESDGGSATRHGDRGQRVGAASQLQAGSATSGQAPARIPPLRSQPTSRAGTPPSARLDRHSPISDARGAGVGSAVDVDVAVDTPPPQAVGPAPWPLRASTSVGRLGEAGVATTSRPPLPTRQVAVAAFPAAAVPLTTHANALSHPHPPSPWLAGATGRVVVAGGGGDADAAGITLLSL